MNNPMKTTIQIKSIFGKILFEYEKEDNTIKQTLIEAVNASANLRGADLWRAKGIIVIEPIGSRGDTLIGCKHDTCIMVKTGCFWETIDEFEAAVKKNHGDSIHGKTYSAAIELMRVVLSGC